VVQNFDGARQVTTLGGAAQALPGGPVASQEAIKELGTNGGGFYKANSSHPYENPDPVANFLEVLAPLVIPFALTATYGRMVGSRRQGWALFAAMAVIWAAMTATVIVAEQAGGLVPTAQMLLGEVSPGGVGTGLYSMLVFVLLAVFIAGLMVGRTPEWLG
jgi:potassium-transporting ATPase potassium-binding subunit